MESVRKGCAAAAGLYCGLGFYVPIAPTLVALGAVLMVRILVWTRSKSIVWNGSVGLLASLATFSTMESTNFSVFTGFWIGVGYGALGVGIIEVGRGLVTTMVTDRFTSALSVLTTGKSTAETKHDEDKP